jgi:hypothetical protein
MNRHEATQTWTQVKGQYEAAGLYLDGVKMFVPDEWKQSNASLASIAMDAAGTLSTDPNSSIPTILTTAIDPDVIRIIFAPLSMADIMGEERRVGDWLEETRLFPVVEDTGEVSSYGDYSNNGRAGINFNYPAFQSYLFQIIMNYGERETARAGLMRINYVGDLGRAAGTMLNRFGNLTYAFGVAGLQNYGLLNNPYLSSYLTPAVKAWGGTTWFNGTSPAATANEVYNDVLAVVQKIIQQTDGAVTLESPMTLALSPSSQEGMLFANSFGVFVKGLLKEGLPQLKIKTAVQYGAQTSTNSQGYSPIGNAMQIIINEIDGQKVCYPAYNEKMRSHKIVPELSAWKQKMTAGTWGTIMRIPAGIGGMLGI